MIRIYLPLAIKGKSEARMNLRGIDVSRWQGKIDWAIVATQIDFAYIKASEYKADPTFAYNWAEAKKYGIPRGGYHFFHPRGKSTEELNIQRVAAETFASLIEDGELYPMIDVEVQDNFNQDYFAASLAYFISCFRKVSKKTLGIYTAPGLWNEFVGPVKKWGAINFSEMPLWNACWGSKCTLPLTWEDKDYLFWQYRVGNEGEMPGIKTRIDLNVFNGDRAKFDALFHGNVIDLPVDPPIVPDPVVPPIEDPTSIKVTGTTRLRKSPWGDIISVLPSGTSLDVCGNKVDSDGKKWYKINAYVASWIL
jgi:lysozyme